MLSRELENYILNNFNAEKSFQDKLLGLYKEFTKENINNFEDFKKSPERFWDFFS